VLVNFSGNEYGEQITLKLLRLADLQELEPRWDELELSLRGQEATVHLSPHGPTFPQVQVSSSVPQ